jgi:ribA/ribD-fused uncharacterized protein
VAEALKEIRFYGGRYWWLSNFAAIRFIWRDKEYATAEHAYQSAKFFDTNPEIAEKIRLSPDPGTAKRLAYEHKDEWSPDWEKQKLGIMYELKYAQIIQNPWFAQKLVETGDAKIIEGSPTDYFWGCGADGSGLDNMGKIYMDLRLDLRSGEGL